MHRGNQVTSWCTADGAVVRAKDAIYEDAQGAWLTDEDAERAFRLIAQEEASGEISRVDEPITYEQEDEQMAAQRRRLQHLRSTRVAEEQRRQRPEPAEVPQPSRQEVTDVLLTLAAINRRNKEKFIGEAAVRDHDVRHSSINTLADINRRNRACWGHA
jgi:hypothetical protein